MKSRRNKQKELFYVELRIAGWVPLFVYPQATKKIIDGLKWCCDKRGLRIYDYSILPDRIILIADTAWGSLHDILDSFKNFSSKAMMLLLRSGKGALQSSWMISAFQEFGPKGKPEGIHIWESELFIESLFKQDQIDEKAVNIHQKVVSQGFVDSPKHYLYCSANPKNPLDGWIVEATDPWS